MKKKKLLVILIVALFLFILTGCSAGSTINTVLYVNSDLSGERVMQIAINEEVFSQYFNGTEEDLYNFVDANCPSEMEWEYNASDDCYEYIFTISFSDPVDYSSKISQITSETHAIEMTTPDSVWASGVYISEDFSSQDLLEWLAGGLIEQGLVSDSNASMIFTNGSTIVNYEGEERNAYSPIYIDEIEYVSIDNVDMFTDINDFDSYSRKVDFKINNNSMLGKETEIDEFFTSKEGKGITYSKSEQEGVTIFTLQQTGLDAKGLMAFAAAVFGDENVNFAVENQDGADSPFTFQECLSEKVDLSQYVVGDVKSPYFTSYVKWPTDFQVMAGSDSNLYEADDYPGYSMIGNSSGLEKITVLYLRKHFNTESIQVDVKRNTITDKWTQKSVLVLEKLPTEEEISAMEAMLCEKAGIVLAEAAVPVNEEASEVDESIVAETEETVEEVEEKEPSYDISINIETTNENKCQIEIKQNGDVQGMTEGTSQLLGDAPTFGYGADKEFWRVKKQEVYHTSIDYAGLTGEVSDDFTIEYNLKVGFAPDMQYSNTDNAVLEGNSLKLTQNSENIYVEYVGTKIDPIALLFWILVILGVVFLIAAVLKSGIIRKKEKPVEKVFPTEAEKIVEEEKNVAGFCEKCGAPRPEDGKFCVQCGSPFED